MKKKSQLNHAVNYLPSEFSSFFHLPFTFCGHPPWPPPYWILVYWKGEAWPVVTASCCWLEFVAFGRGMEEAMGGAGGAGGGGGLGPACQTLFSSWSPRVKLCVDVCMSWPLIRGWDTAAPDPHGRIAGWVCGDPATLMPPISPFHHHQEVNEPQWALQALCLRACVCVFEVGGGALRRGARRRLPPFFASVVLRSSLNRWSGCVCLGVENNVGLTLNS